MTKPVLILLLMLSSLAAYFMNHYNVVIDDTMIQNMLKTNVNEALDLLSPQLLYYCLFLGVLPAFLVFIIKLEPTPWKKTTLIKTRDCLISLLVILVMLLSFSRFYTSFFREHKPLRYYTNPSYYIYSTGKYLNKTFSSTRITVRPIGEDAKKSAADPERKLVISFTNMYSCATTTALSVPCMFSILPRAEYSEAKGEAVENLLDVLGHAYDNAILYTDYFLTQVIGLLKKNSTGFETAMLYMGDHGESLGEYNIYLHGLPYAMAPDSQKHIAAFFWFDDGFKIDRQPLRDKSSAPFSHDNLFHTVLGLMKVETSVYDKGMDILAK